MKHTYEAWQIQDWMDRHQSTLTAEEYGIAQIARCWADYEMPDFLSAEIREREHAEREKAMTAFRELRARIG